jgi:hypothetical protein
VLLAQDVVTLPDPVIGVAVSVLPLQTESYRRWGLCFTRLDRRVVRIVTVGAIVEHPLSLPRSSSFTMGAEVPILMMGRMAAPTHQMCLIKVDCLIQVGSQIVSLCGVVTGQTPDSALTVIEIRRVRSL